MELDAQLAETMEKNNSTLPPNNMHSEEKKMLENNRLDQSDCSSAVHLNSSIVGVGFGQSDLPS